MNDRSPMMILCTTPNLESARAIALDLLQSRVVACVNILGRGTSLYWWEGKVEEATEHLLIIKTVKDNFAAIQNRIEKLHPYDVPEVIGFESDTISERYATWLQQSARVKRS